MKQYLFILIALLALLGCGKHSSPTNDDTDVIAKDTTQIQKPVPVKHFALSFSSPVANGKKTVLGKVVASDTPVDFDMGIIKGTKSFPFLMNNNSTDPLTDITITSSNAKFTTAPSRIKTIGVPTESVGNNVLIQVTAIHGLSESGNGVFVPVITEDDDTTTITIAGMFGDSSFTVSYSLRVTPAYVDVNNGWLGSVGHNCPITYTYSTRDGERPVVTADALPTTAEIQAGGNVVLGSASVFFDCVSDDPKMRSVTDLSQLSGLYFPDPMLK